MKLLCADCGAEIADGPVDVRFLRCHECERTIFGPTLEEQLHAILDEVPLDKVVKANNKLEEV